mmetsp:Transcript_37464/g.80713  ORF Transcript_37464/g.80713 Transcript_37464/m.80713 type:complete len:115 (-) Transcript_37464:76-420(-)
MVYIADFESFIQEAEDLYRASPLDTRYSIKYRHCDGKLVLKVTDDRRCIQFRTDQQQDLKRMERITSMFFALFATGELPEGGEGDAMAVDTAAKASAVTAAAGATKGKKPRRKG